MFVIRDKITNKYFCKEHTKVIIFNTPEEASNFISQFIQYAMQRMMQEDPFKIAEVMHLSNNLVIDKLQDNNFSESINFSNLKK